MQIKIKLALTIVFASYVHAHAQQTIAYTCDFTNTFGAKWVNGTWVDANFYPRKSFNLKLKMEALMSKVLLNYWVDGAVSTQHAHISTLLEVITNIFGVCKHLYQAKC